MSHLNDEVVLDIPELLRKVNVVVVGILKSEYLLPHTADLSYAACLDLVKRGKIVHKLALVEHPDEKLLCGVVGEGLALPGAVGIEELDRLAVVNRLVVEANEVSFSLTGILVSLAVYLLEMRSCDLCRVFAELDLRNNVTFLILNCA